MVILIDNYDSFTYNLYQYIGEYDSDIEVYRNDKITAEEIQERRPDRLIISPGPKTPNEAGNCMDIIQKLSEQLPILGICLGHQCIGQAFGGTIIHAKQIFHGKVSRIHHNDQDLFHGLPNPLKVARYHSLIVEKKSLPSTLESVAETKVGGEIMALQHQHFNTYGLQFHPESILCEQGRQLIYNFMILKGGVRSDSIIYS